MANTISNQAHLNPHSLRQHNNKNLVDGVHRQHAAKESSQKVEDSVTITHHQEVSMTYESTLTIQPGNTQDQYNLLRGLVASMLKEQGIDMKVAVGDTTIDINELSQEEAAALVADDGYFGIEQTSDRIVEFAIAAAGGDTSKLAAIKEGVEKGFNDAMEAFGGELPEISYNTYDAVMEKLDAWAEVDSPEVASE